MVNESLWYCHKQIKENIFEKVKKKIPRDVILFSFSINLNITYLTKHINSDILEYTMFQNKYIFFLLPQIHL